LHRLPYVLRISRHLISKVKNSLAGSFRA
jgi:hypothetical protein